MSRGNTLTAAARPSRTPSGPTRTPSITPTPYTRPPDPPDVDLSLPIARIDDEDITLGEFRARVRYERFAMLDDIRRTVSAMNVDRLDLTAPTAGAVENAIAARLTTLADTRSFGRQVYDMLIRETLIRHEFEARDLALDPEGQRGYWIRRFGLQNDPARDEKYGALRDAFVEEAARFSGLTPEAILATADVSTRSEALRPIIVAERRPPVDLLKLRAWRIVTDSRDSADVARAALDAGQDFRAVACEYSTDPAAHGDRGNVGWVTAGRLTAGLEGADAIFSAAPGAIVGPLHSPLGWHIFRVNELRQTADGDTQARLQSIVVAGEDIGRDVAARAANGEDFAALACAYSQDAPTGTGGDLGTVGERDLAPEVMRAIRATEDTGLFGPIETVDGFEIVRVDERTVDVPDPADLAEAASSAYVDWQDEQAAPERVRTLSDAWRDAMPADPLPRDVATYLTEEFFGMPTPAPTGTGTSEG
jgi:parvulin-like peptidyl-prolyl isomerase